MKLTPYQLQIQEAIYKKLWYIKKIIPKSDWTEWYFELYKWERVVSPVISLSRVLYCLGDDYIFVNNKIVYIWPLWVDDIVMCNRQLLNEDGSEKNLWDQEEEVQKIIWDILLGNK